MDTLFPDLPTAVHHDEARLRAVVPPRHDDAPETLTRGGERGRIDPARKGFGRVVMARRHDGAQARLVVVDGGGEVGKEGVHVPPSLGGRTDRPRPLSGPTPARAWRAEW